MRLALALLVFGACGKSGSTDNAAPPDPGPLINQMTDFAERCDACKTDHDCMRPLRDEFDGVKGSLLANGHRLVGDDLARFDAALMRLRACGDGGGLTFWVGQ